jgi:hypothetical protein
MLWIIVPIFPSLINENEENLVSKNLAIQIIFLSIW